MNVEPGSGNGNHGIVTHTAVVSPATASVLVLSLSLFSSLFFPRSLSLYLSIYPPASVVRTLSLIFQPAQPCRSYLARWQDTSVRTVPDFHRHHHNLHRDHHHHRRLGRRYTYSVARCESASTEYQARTPRRRTCPRPSKRSSGKKATLLRMSEVTLRKGLVRGRRQRRRWLTLSSSLSISRRPRYIRLGCDARERDRVFC